MLCDYQSKIIDDFDRLLARGIIDKPTDAALRDGICAPLIVPGPARWRSLARYWSRPRARSGRSERKAGLSERWPLDNR